MSAASPGRIRIVSGGQTGADRGALDAALALDLEVGGWVPLGRLAEDGVIPPEYPNRREADSPEPARRTALNVRDSDATLILSHGELTGGSSLTARKAEELGRPCFHVDLARCSFDDAVAAVRRWLSDIDAAVLNVAGPRASRDATIYRATRALLMAVIGSVE